MPFYNFRFMSRIGVPLAFAVLIALLVGVSLSRKSNEDDKNNLPPAEEKLENVRHIAARKAADNDDKTAARRKRLVEAEMRHQAAAIERFASEENAFAPSKGTDATAFAESDDAFMARLRDMWMVQPEVALRLADEGEQRVKDTPYAAECAWIAIRALVEMGDFASAREKSKEMVEMYRGTHWAMDIQRHMLSHPPDE